MARADGCRTAESRVANQLVTVCGKYPFEGEGVLALVRVVHEILNVLIGLERKLVIEDAKAPHP
jgi:hypothetical protein